eukprot:TRINITY_DN15758_c0_g1_i1.p1 TRINITY_DN15758_c0_g1~~TRINITY_DN15758_c0_g1_i1.p1  ORF type:complete len:322 (+),score=65.35 TRINITY_DN15758_c0_g1_i1:82-966(+)
MQPSRKGGAEGLLCAAGALHPAPRRTAKGGGAEGLILYLSVDGADSGYLPVQLSMDATVGDLRRAAAEAAGRAGGHVTLRFGGQMLADAEDGQELANIGISQEAVVGVEFGLTLDCRHCSDKLLMEPLPPNEVKFTKKSGHGNAAAVLVPPCEPGGKAVWEVTVGQNVSGSCYLIGVTQRPPEEWDNLGRDSHDFYEWTKGHKGSWTWEDCGAGYLGGCTSRLHEYRDGNICRFTLDLSTDSARLDMELFKTAADRDGGHFSKSHTVEVPAGRPTWFLISLFNASASFTVRRTM